jgi:hypothetical protein
MKNHDLTNAASMGLAVNLAASNRFCPPDTILFQTSRDAHLEQHIQNCPACQERLDMDLKPWKALLEIMGRDAPRGMDVPPEPGQLWTLDPALEGWDDADRYLNTPFVLLLEAPKNENVLAAQVYWDTSLLCADDVHLGQEMGFAQPWNTRQLPVPALFSCRGAAAPEDLSRTIRQSRSSGNTAQDLHPLLQSFRNQEQALLSTIGLRAEQAQVRVAETIKHLMADFARRFQLSLAEAGRRLQVGLIRTLDIGALLAHSSYAEESAAMAAATAEQFQALVVREEQGEPRVVDQAVVDLTALRTSDEGFLIAGRFPDDLAPQRARVWWTEPRKSRMEAPECSISGQFFQAVIPRLFEPDLAAGRPKMLIYTA